MKIVCILAAIVAVTLGVPHASHNKGHPSVPHWQRQLNKRQMRGSEPGEISTGPEIDSSKQYAFSVESNNQNQLVGKSVAAAASGGQAGLASMWSGFIPSGGNPYALYYAGNGKGRLIQGKANKAAAAGRPSQAVPNDQATAIIKMMEQIGTVV